ncbi:MAG TPA: RNA polymerase sigma factor [Vicinamibacterales bacterium]|nr:RNA polymerase sigma factor [Vicinamibacterales bacterium]
MAEWDPPDPRNNAELAQLMTAYQTGSMDAFEKLYAALASPLLSYLASLCRDRTHAHDLLQEAFLQIHRSRRAYRPDLPVRPWAFTIARHVWLMDVRSRGRRPRPSEDLPDLPVPAEVEGLAARETLRCALASLLPDRREALLLHHVWGFSFAEIGQLLGIRADAAKLRSSRAMADLRRMLVEDAPRG